MTEQEFLALQQWQTNNVLDGIRCLLTVKDAESLTELLRLTELAESYRLHYPVT